MGACLGGRPGKQGVVVLVLGVGERDRVWGAKAPRLKLPNLQPTPSTSQLSPLTTLPQPPGLTMMAPW